MHFRLTAMFLQTNLAWKRNHSRVLLLFCGCLYFPSPGPLHCPHPLTLVPTPGPRPLPSVCIYRPWHPICIYRSWSPIFIYQPWPTTLLPVQSLSLHTPSLSPQFVNVFTALTYNLYYRSGAWICIYHIFGSSSGSSNSGSSNFFWINNTTFVRRF